MEAAQSNASELYKGPWTLIELAVRDRVVGEIEPTYGLTHRMGARTLTTTVGSKTGVIGEILELNQDRILDPGDWSNATPPVKNTTVEIT